MKVRDIMRREVVTVHPDDTVGRLMDVLTTAAISGAPVIDGGGNVLGVVSTNDVLRLAADRTRREHRAERGPVVPEPGRAPNNGRAAEPAALDAPMGERGRTERDLLSKAREERWTMDRLEREYIFTMLEEMRGHQGRVSEVLGINRRTLYRKLQRYRKEGLRPPVEPVPAGD